MNEHLSKYNNNFDRLINNIKQHILDFIEEIDKDIFPINDEKIQNSIEIEKNDVDEQNIDKEIVCEDDDINKEIIIDNKEDVLNLVDNIMCKIEIDNTNVACSDKNEENNDNHNSS